MRVKQNWIRLYFNETLFPGNADREKCTVVVVIKSIFFPFYHGNYARAPLLQLSIIGTPTLEGVQ